MRALNFKLRHYPGQGEDGAILQKWRVAGSAAARRTGQVSSSRPKGTPIAVPRPSWSVLRRRSLRERMESERERADRAEARASRAEAEREEAQVRAAAAEGEAKGLRLALDSGLTLGPND